MGLGHLRPKLWGSTEEGLDLSAPGVRVASRPGLGNVPVRTPDLESHS
jgi:hypothetical protein